MKTKKEEIGALVIYEDKESLTVLPKNGTDFKLSEFKEYLEDKSIFFESIYLPNNIMMLVDEDGLSKNLKENFLASTIAKQRIVGPAILIDTKLLK